MSEFQVVKFRAIDRPLTAKQLEFMDRQSSRAEFTSWEFEVDYHYSSFRGDVNGMLRNGYDIFLTYSNYDGREIRMRLPDGLPFSKSVRSKYLSAEGLRWEADKSGKAGIVTLSPYVEEANDEVWEFDDYLASTAKLRAMLIAGDLRALYALWLCNAVSSSENAENVMEPPVPYGMDSFPKEAAELFGFFEADSLLVDAAAVGIPEFNGQENQSELVNTWLKSTTNSRQTEILKRLLSEDPISLKAELLSEVRNSQQATAWPVEQPSRSLADLLNNYEILREKRDKKLIQQAAIEAKKEADKKEKQRQERMSKMKSAPAIWLKKASQLVEERQTNSYREAASILADLRDAIGGEKGIKIAHEHAVHLAKSYPTLNVLKSSLRKCGLLD